MNEAALLSVMSAFATIMIVVLFAIGVIFLGMGLMYIVRLNSPGQTGGRPVTASMILWTFVAGFGLVNLAGTGNLLYSSVYMDDGSYEVNQALAPKNWPKATNDGESAKVMATILDLAFKMFALYALGQAMIVLKKMSDPSLAGPQEAYTPGKAIGYMIAFIALVNVEKTTAAIAWVFPVFDNFVKFLGQSLA